VSTPPTRAARVSAAAVKLRPAAMVDCQRIWVWRNDPETRAASFDTAEIPWDEHQRWFSASLERPDRRIYLITVEDRPQGVARLDVVGSEAAVSIHLAPEARGRGIGTAVLQELARSALAERDGQWLAVGPIAAGVPATFADAVGRRLASVDADARRVIHAAAALGRGFDWPLLGRITGLADGQYTLVAAGHRPATVAIRIGAGETATVRVALGE